MGCRVQGSGCRVKGLAYRVYVYGSWFWVLGLIRVKGL